MLRFATVRGRSFSKDYMGSVACFDKQDNQIAVCQRNPRQLEDEDYEPLTMKEIMVMATTGEIDHERLDAWVGDPCLWHCWELKVEIEDPEALQLAIAAAYNALLAAEHLILSDSSED
jgi:hypothetical protein